MNGEQQGAAEGSDKVAEVPPSEFPLALGAKPDYAGVLNQNAHREHVAEHGVAHIYGDGIRRVAQPGIQLLVAGFSDRSNSAVRRRNGGFSCRIWAPTVRRDKINCWNCLKRNFAESSS